MTSEPLLMLPSAVLWLCNERGSKVLNSWENKSIDMYPIMSVVLFKTVAHVREQIMRKHVKRQEESFLIWWIKETPTVFPLYFSSMCVCAGFCRAAAGGANESDPDWPWHHRLPAAEEAQVSGGSERGPSFSRHCEHRLNFVVAAAVIWLWVAAANLEDAVTPGPHWTQWGPPVGVYPHWSRLRHSSRQMGAVARAAWRARSSSTCSNWTRTGSGRKLNTVRVNLCWVENQKGIDGF